jgi:hypothetical protein
MKKMKLSSLIQRYAGIAKENAGPYRAKTEI